MHTEAKEIASEERENVESNQLGATKAIYVGESVKVLQSIILKADPVLNEMCSLIKEF